jgi:ribose 5-phosphate isomerase B
MEAFMRIVIANDHGAVVLKNEIKEYLIANNHEVVDIGVNSEESVDYPEIAVKACTEFKKEPYDFGILLCGTGIGISMAANKIRGIRCALVHDSFTAAMAKKHNNANFIALGGRVIYAEPVTTILEAFMKASFEDGRHSRRVEQLNNLP